MNIPFRLLKVDHGQFQLEAVCVVIHPPHPPSPVSLSAGGSSPPLPSPTPPGGGRNSVAHRPAPLPSRHTDTLPRSPSLPPPQSSVLTTRTTNTRFAPLPPHSSPHSPPPALPPPHSSMLTPGTSTTRTTSSYFSPNMAVAPPALASVSPITRVCMWSGAEVFRV